MRPRKTITIDPHRSGFNAMSLSTGSTLSGAPLPIEYDIDEPPVSGPETGPPGLIAKIARGSLWNLSGQLITLLASVLATPIVIRLLGTEAYGVLALVN